MDRENLRLMGVALYMLGVLAELESRGLINCGMKVTPKGTAAFDQLAASGYVPSPEERRSFLKSQFGTGDPKAIDAAELMVDQFIAGTLDASLAKFHEARP